MEPDAVWTLPLVPHTAETEGGFLDLEGTLIPPKEEALTVNNESGNCLARSKRGEIPAVVLAGLEGLFRDGSFLLFATTLPFEDGIRRCKRHAVFSAAEFLPVGHILFWKGTGKRRKGTFFWMVLFYGYWSPLRKNLHVGF